jgi:protein-tyrosine phosphatase/nicotinamidase-related amidase
MISVLITQCLQRDFVDPIRALDPPPNLLHVGHAEALRLLGPDPIAGPVAQLMTWAREQPPEELAILHIRDWHDPDDARQKDHLDTFGAHCLRGTPGARLVLDLDDDVGQRPHEHTVDALTLNDFEGTDLAARLAQVKARAGGQPVRVGVVGVWTEAKVSFVLYDLKTRMGIDALATCSALTASASRAQHFNALEQLRRILGVEVFDSVGAFAQWLAPGSAPRLARAPSRFGVAVEVQGAPPLSVAERDIVAHLYRDSKQVSLAPLSGGFSGALVFQATSIDAFSHEQAPSVLKLGPHALIASERVAFERVEEVLGNSAPSVRGFVDFGERAGIKYSFASMGHGAVRTLKTLFDRGTPVDRLEGILRDVFDAILGRLYAAASYERCPALEHYGFSTEHVPKVKSALAAIDSASDAGARLLAFYERFLAEPRPPREAFHFVSYVHGDLNAANVLIDARDNVWIIDFFHTSRGHVLKDVAKLENDLCYILTPLATRAELAEALLVTRALRQVADLREPLPESPPEGVHVPSLVRCWRCLRVLREVAGRLCREDRHPLQLQVALLRYAAQTLGFEESSPLQKQWALEAAAGWADDVAATLRADRVLRIDWLDPAVLGGTGRLGMTLCPGRRDRGRDLGVDLDVLVREGVTRMLSLLPDTELEWAGVSSMAAEAERRGLQLRQVPIPDQGTPGHDEALELTRWILDAVDRGESVVMHCMGGLGRTGTIAACALVARGQRADEAIEAVRRSRGPRAVETREQERFVRAFAGGQS